MTEFTPRLSADGIYLSKYYYSDNPYNWEGNGLPNCTCYAWGRFYEISDVYPSKLPLGNAGEWYPKAVISGNCELGEAPALGAIICWKSTVGGAGHVGIVEKINEDGSFLVSQSGYYRPIATYPPDTEDYFWVDTCDPVTRLVPWMGDRYSFQGFIYNPEQPIPPNPSPSTKKRKMPLWMYLRYF